MSTTETVLSTLEQITVTDQVRIDLDLPLYEEGILDSLGTIELIVALSEAFGIQITPAEIDREQWGTPRKIIAYMEGRLEAMA